jgi:hypothetical protein
VARALARFYIVMLTRLSGCQRSLVNANQAFFKNPAASTTG